MYVYMCSGYETSRPNASSMQGKLASDRYAATQATADPSVRMQGEQVLKENPAELKTQGITCNGHAAQTAGVDLSFCILNIKA